MPPDSQWLNHHGKRKNYLWLIILALAVCVAAALFIRNNSDFLGVSKKQKNDLIAAESPVVSMPAHATQAPPAAAAQQQAAPSPARPEPPKAAREPAVVKPASVTKGKAATAEKTQPKTPPAAPVAHAAPVAPVAKAVSAAPASESVLLDKITCRLMDKSQPSILLSLSVSFPQNKALRQEILVKRDNLKVLVKRTLATKSLDDMIVDSLRKDLESGLNSVLENGAVTDIEFKEFRIEKVE
jgi:flagellar basal body-associated protein FliL